MLRLETFSLVNFPKVLFAWLNVRKPINSRREMLTFKYFATLRTTEIKV